ncbi:MAG: glycosyltransferase family 2 protein [Candidatus Altiarchaeales archaeon]|nr:glycosyltransferase family 2 protein [Candidatus Altiarchaeales archaeon]
MNKKPSVSVLVPAYNEASLIRETVNELVSYLKTLDLDSFEVIICVNGSTDSTEEVSKQLSEEFREVKYFSIKNRGFGLALTEGIKRASKEVITFVPGDGEINPEFIGNSLALMNEYDFVSGSRYIDNKSVGSSRLRRLLSFAFAVFFRTLFGFNLTEVGTVKMFKTRWARGVVDKLTEKNYAWQIQTTYHALSSGLKVTEIPVKTRVKRDSSQSKVKIISDGLSLFLTCLKYGIMLNFHKTFKR